MLRKLESSICFAAALLAIVLEGACVWWMWVHESLRPWASASPADLTDAANVTGIWTGSAFPQCGILCGLIVLLFRLGQMLRPPTTWDDRTKAQNRHAFLRLWRFVVALMLVEGFTLYVGSVGVTP
jgi:hypothetical protein